MTNSFHPDAPNAPTVRVGFNIATDIVLPDRSEPISRESIRLLAIGTPKGVKALIARLHQLGFAEATAWSRLMPTGNPSEVMSILTWSVWVE